MNNYVAPEFYVIEMVTDTSLLLLVSGENSTVTDLDDCIVG